MSKPSRNTLAVANVTETPAPVTVAPKSGNAVNPNSIRQLICGSLKSGKSTSEITEMLKAQHPNSAAAAKATKHIGWYRSDMRKRGELPKVGAVVASTAPAE